MNDLGEVTPTEMMQKHMERDRARELERLRARVADLEREVGELRAELRRANLPEITEAWD